MSRVPVDVVVCQLMMYGNVIVNIIISRGLFVFSQSRVKVSTSLTNIKGREGVKWELGFAFFGGWEMGFRALGLGFIKKTIEKWEWDFNLSNTG